MLSPDDNEEQYTAWELFQMLKAGGSVMIGDEICDISDITDKLDENQLQECVQAQALGDMDLTNKTYIDVIGGLIA